MLSLLGLLVPLLIPGTSAQSSVASCTLASFRWAFNSHNQSPCDVAASLLGICTDAYTVQPLQESSHYLGPSIDTANDCQCSSVAYSMLSACGLCQNRTIAQWSEWSAGCAKVSVRTFPLPLKPDLHVPGWAYLDVKEHDIFDVNLAKLNSNLTESTYVPQPTTTTASSSSASPTPSVSAAQATAEAEAAEAHLRDIIGGSIVGGVLGLLVLAVLLLGFQQLRKAKRLPKPDPETAAARQSFSSSDKKSENESQMSEIPVPILRLHPAPAEYTPSPTSGTFSLPGSDGSLSPTRPTHSA